LPKKRFTKSAEDAIPPLNTLSATAVEVDVSGPESRLVLAVID
jgi:hypothetical protein